MIPSDLLLFGVCKLRLTEDMSVPVTPSHQQSNCRQIKPFSLNSTPILKSKQKHSSSICLTNKRRCNDLKKYFKNTRQESMNIIKNMNHVVEQIKKQTKITKPYNFGTTSFGSLYCVNLLCKIFNLDILQIFDLHINCFQLYQILPENWNLIVESNFIYTPKRSNLDALNLKSKYFDTIHSSGSIFYMHLFLSQLNTARNLNFFSDNFNCLITKKFPMRLYTSATSKLNLKSLPLIIDSNFKKLRNLSHSLTQNHSILQNIISFLNAREVIKLLLSLNINQFVLNDDMDDWNLWKSNEASVKHMCPSMFMNRNKSFFDRKYSDAYKSKQNKAFKIEHVVLDKWWNNLKGREDNAFVKILSQSPIKTIRVEPSFYLCPCQSCVSSTNFPNTIYENNYYESRSPRSDASSGSMNLSTEQPEGLENSSFLEFNIPFSLSNRDLTRRLTTTSGTINNSFSRTQLSSQTNLPSSPHETENSSGFDLQRTDAPSPNSVMSPANENDRRPTHQLAECHTFNMANISNTGDITPTNNYEESTDTFTLNDRYSEFVPSIKETTTDSLTHFVAKRHAIARFFWLLRLLLICRDTVEYIDFDGPPEYLQTMCDHISTIPELPINFKTVVKPFVFDKLKRMHFGIATDCRYVVPLLDFCKYKSLRTIQVIGLTANYEILKPQFGVQPTMMFSPQQVFLPPTDSSTSKWLPAVYNGSIDEKFQLQGKGVYVSREYHYEGSFKNGRNHGWGKMISKCGEVYEGYWVEGRRCGPGVVMQTLGKRLEGFWMCDCMHGRGTMITRTGRKYEGDWINGTLDGWGVISENGKLQAISQFYDGVPCGWMRCRTSYFRSSHIRLVVCPPPIKTVPFNLEAQLYNPVKPFNSRMILGLTAIKLENSNDLNATESECKLDNSYEQMISSDNVISYELLKEINDHYIESNINFEPLVLSSKDSNNLKSYNLKPLQKQKVKSVLEQLNDSEWMDVWTFSCSIKDLHARGLQLLNPPQSVNDIFVLNSQVLIQQLGLRPKFDEAHKLTIPQIPQWVEQLVSVLSI